MHFVPAHPVAGTENSGPDSGFAELFVNRWCILTPPDNADQAAVERLASFWRALGANVESMPADHHDLVLAVTSHLPHLIAYTIVGTADELGEVTRSEVLKFSAGGFRDFTRIAASDPTMWRTSDRRGPRGLHHPGSPGAPPGDGRGQEHLHRHAADRGLAQVVDRGQDAAFRPGEQPQPDLTEQDAEGRQGRGDPRPRARRQRATGSDHRCQPDGVADTGGHDQQPGGDCERPAEDDDQRGADERRDSSEGDPRTGARPVGVSGTRAEPHQRWPGIGRLRRAVALGGRTRGRRRSPATLGGLSGPGGRGGSVTNAS